MKKTIYICFILISFQCRERYDVPFRSPVTGFLVAEGIINYGGTTTISLSRTSQLESAGFVPEKSAMVTVEGQDNSSIQLNEQDSGRYVFDQLPLDLNTRYRVKIITANNKEYVSDFKPVIQTPVIDSLTWKRQYGGLEVFVNAHDDQKDTRYYKWDYTETWEFHSAFKKTLKYVFTPLEKYKENYQNHSSLNGDLVTISYMNGSRPGVYDTAMYQCWKTREAAGIKIGTTTRLSSDIVYVPLVFYPEASWELSVLYSIIVTQYGLSKEGYEFFAKMKKNSESLGSIFDAQPSELEGNIKCVTDSSEKVIGFIEVTSEHRKRIFISNDDLPDWNYRQPCEQYEIWNTPIAFQAKSCDSLSSPGYRSPGYIYPIRQCAYEAGLIPTTPNKPELQSFNVTDKECADCRMRGSSERPSFWPQ